MSDDKTEHPKFVPPPPDPELRRLEPLLGTWRAEERTQDSMLGPGVPVASTESFHWLDGGYFIVQTYETIKLNPDGTVSVAWWLRDENGDWKSWMTNTFTKIEK